MARIYTDGANTWTYGDKGHAGIGVYVEQSEMFGDTNKGLEISRYIGIQTNNVAELMAIRIALIIAAEIDEPVIIYSDSAYAIGILTNKTWVPKKNIHLVKEIRAMLDKLPLITFKKVKGHSGVPGNEIADRLAKEGKEFGVNSAKETENEMGAH